MWSLSKAGPGRPMTSSTWVWALLLPATDHRSCPGGRRQRAFTVLAVFLFLPRFPASGCPDVCSCSLGKVNCVDRGLRFVPLQLPTNATALLLDYNRIAILRNGTFAAQKVLRRLSLGNNLLAGIHRLALVGLHELQDLDLSDNSLSLLHPETFLPVPTLRTLKLGNNRLLRLEPELPGALPHLRALFVHSNALTSLPPGFFESLPSLSYLTLADNPWTCSCAIRPLFLWLVKNRDKVPGKQPPSVCLSPSRPPWALAVQLSTSEVVEATRPCPAAPWVGAFMPVHLGCYPRGCSARLCSQPLVVKEAARSGLFA